MAVYGSPFLQSTLIFLSTTNRCKRFFLSRSFLNQCSLVSGKPVAYAMNSYVILNFKEATLTQPSLNILKNSNSTTMSNLRNFCRNGRNLDSCNSARLFLHSAFVQFLQRQQFIPHRCHFEPHSTLLCSHPQKNF